MEITEHFLNWRRVPIGARLHERLKPLGLIRLWLLVLLIGWSASASAEVEPDFKNKSVKVDISGNLHYKFEFKFFNLKGDNYEWGQETYLTVDGSSICKLNDLAYAIGTSDEGKVKTFVKNYGGKSVITKDCNISGVTDVYVTLGNPYRSGDDFYMECDVCIERNYKDKTWDIGMKGYWHYNNGKGHSVNEKVFTTSAPSVSMPTISTSNFKRKNNKIEFTYPGVSSSYSGWSNQTILYKEDNANKWKNPSYAYGTYTSDGSFDVTDNYTPVTVYPRFEFYKDNGTVSTWGSAKTVRFDKDYGAITIPGQPKPKDITISSYNTYDKSVTITWARDEYDSKTATDGRWVIFRKKTGDGSSQVRLGDVPNGTYKYTDETGALDYGTTYTYTVCYDPKGWNIGHESEASGLSWYVRYKLNRDFAFSNLKTEVKDGKITETLSETERTYVSATAKFVNVDDGEVIVVNAEAREPAQKTGMDSSQITGTASSYARKYALNGLFCIDDTKDADTDEYHNQTTKKTVAKSVSEYLHDIDNAETEQQINNLFYEWSKIYVKGTEDYKILTNKSFERKKQIVGD